MIVPYKLSHNVVPEHVFKLLLYFLINVYYNVIISTKGISMDDIDIDDMDDIDMDEYDEFLTQPIPDGMLTLWERLKLETEMIIFQNYMRNMVWPVRRYV